MGQKAPAASWWGDDSRTEKNRRVRSLASKVSRASKLLSYKTWVFECQMPESYKNQGVKFML